MTPREKEEVNAAVDRINRLGSLLSTLGASVGATANAQATLEESLQGASDFAHMIAIDLQRAALSQREA